jgi:glutathione S-transferase
VAELTFYTNPMSRGQIVRWMLEEVGAHYETRILDYGSTMKEPEYLLVNPMGKVPAIRHGDKVVTEVAAICAYLADAFPEAGLGPRPDERADYYRWLFFAAGPIEQAVTNRACGFTPTVEQGRMVGYGSYDLAIDVLDGWMGQRDYVCGERFTAADVVVGSHIMWGLQFGSIPHRPAFDAYEGRLSTREAYQRARAIDSQLIAAMQADVPSEG